MKILLFDIDGVLVKPYGYRKAFFETYKWIINKSNVNVNLPDDNIPALFESYGVTCEWDMLSISASIMLNYVLEKNQLSLNSDSLETALSELSSLEKSPIELDFRQYIEQLSSTFDLHEIPSIAVMQYGRNHLSGISNELITDIFGDTRSAENTLITRIFQNLVLGSETFEQTYPLESRIKCDSYLRTYDTPIISEQTKIQLNKEKEAGKFCYAGLTARPSLQPRDIAVTDGIAYSPEAELALDVIHMPDMPLIGFGRLQYIEQLIGTSADLLIKPDVFHALAAIFALLGNSESMGLKAAAEIRQGKGIPEWAQGKFNEPLTLCVFEDSQGGVRSVVSAAKLLYQMGIETITRAYGITTNKDKEKTLRGLNAMIFSDINAALNYEFNL